MEFVCAEKIAIQMDRMIRQSLGNRTNRISKAMKSKPTSFAAFWLIKGLGYKVDKWQSVKESIEAYNSHMGIINPKLFTDEIQDTQFTSASLSNYEVSRGLKMLEEEYNIERQIGKKNIKSRARSQRMHFDGTPSAWRLPEEFKAVQNILNRPEVH